MANAALEEPVITVSGVGKRYLTGEDQSGYALLSERIAAGVQAPWQWLRGRSAERSSDQELFWALRDISFEVHHGETLGIIGRNGAGKSTMLKLLSKITLPTEGRITAIGRVATLLEVGTGFHPELTGRENVYLNGTILGMRRREIDARFEEIVEFSGVERFIDTPVKRYSSGMYIRLAFAIAAHLDPEIMLVDEVLAVGDTEFQKKCMGKIRDVAETGRAIVFVSHNLNAIQHLCSRVILLEAGRVVNDGSPVDVLTDYYDRISPEQAGGVANISPAHERGGAGGGRLLQAKMLSMEGQPISALHRGQPFRVQVKFELEEQTDAVIEIGISSGEGNRGVTVFSVDGGRPPFRLPAGTHEIETELRLTMVPGDYLIDIALHAPGNITSKGTQTPAMDVVERVLRFTALSTDESQEEGWPLWRSPEGFANPEVTWRKVTAEEPIPL